MRAVIHRKLPLEETGDDGGCMAGFKWFIRSENMKQNDASRKYAAFISYRHVSPDKETARPLQFPCPETHGDRI